MKVIEAKKSIFKFAVITGLSLFYLHMPLVYRYYPAQFFKILLMVIMLTLGLMPVLYLMPKFKEDQLVSLLFLTSVPASFVVTIMCVFTGGFASVFFMLQLGTIILSSVLYFMPPKQYAILVICYMLQHHIILLFVPWELKELLKNLFFLLPYAAAVIVIHYIVYNFQEEFERLIGYIPICSSCRKIRDDQGAWSQIEPFLAKKTDADFTHSICPECAKKLYGDVLGE